MKGIRYPLTLALLLLSLIFPGAAFAQNILVKDQSLVIEENRRPVGIKLNRLWRTDTGYRYIIDLYYQKIQPDGAPVQTAKHMELDVDASYFARSLNVLTNENGSITQIQGQFQDNQLELITTTPDNQVKSTVYQLEDPVYFNGSLYDCLGAGGRLKMGETFRMNVFDLQMAAFGEELFTVEKREYKFKNKTIDTLAVLKAGNPEPVAFIEGKGDLYWEFDPFLQMSFRKIEPSEYLDLKSRLASFGMIPGKTRVNYPLRSAASEIRLVMDQLKPDNYSLEDNRQTVTGRKTTGNRNELLLFIARDERDFTGKITLPVKRKELAPYLAGSVTDFIAPVLPEVKKLSGEILENETDGWAAARKLVEWVAAYIHPGVPPKTLKTGEILAQQTGTPMENAILFAALARSAGLPARIVSGMRFKDGIWFATTWNEVWLGEWVAVDASQNQTAPDSLLVKLIHSDNIAVIQKMNAALTGNLSIELLDVLIPEPAPDELATMKTGVYGLTYWNAEYLCQIKAPEGWKLIETTEAGMPVLIAHPLNNYDISGILTIFEIPEGTTLKEALRLHFQNLQVDVSQYLLIQQQSVMAETTFLPAGNFSLQSDEFFFKYQNWLATSGNRGFLLVCITPDEEWVNFENDFQKLRDQFIIMENIIK